MCSCNAVICTISFLRYCGRTGANAEIEIPSQGSNTYSVFLLLLKTRDVPVDLTNIKDDNKAVVGPGQMPMM